MFRRQAAIAAIGVALAATVLASPGNAQSDAPRDTSAAPAESATPLALRPAKPLELAQEPAHAGWGWKVVAVLALLGGAAFYLRKRVGPKRLDDGQLTIVRRAAVGIRSEILIVNVEGQRLLLGVTPNSIQSLAVLDGNEAVGEQLAAAPAQEQVGDRFAAMLKSAEERTGVSRADGSPRAEEGPRPAAAFARAGEGPRTAAPFGHAADGPRTAAPFGHAADEVAGQARGLLALRRQG